ncbi:superoxide dismutase family protein [Streptomyces sp. NBC_01537]|uniref:superoxide dismutase family protein n=1 Tax=Streptomyces sp. NBC_01537 TaxID=2903896 RepID=UPI00386D8ABD
MRFRHALGAAAAAALSIVPMVLAAPARAAADPFFPVAVVLGRFAAPDRAEPEPAAVTYDPAAVPVGAWALVTERHLDGGGTRVILRLRGLPGDGRAYEARVHTKSCGPKPADAGPEYAKPLKLDLTADRLGQGMGEAVVAWRFGAGGARSVVIGDGLACVSVRFV